MFDVAIYTDTRANEAIDGIDGFNFQAISEGITAQDRQVIRSNMLHRVVVGWNVEHDPLDQLPSPTTGTAGAITSRVVSQRVSPTMAALATY